MAHAIVNGVGTYYFYGHDSDKHMESKLGFKQFLVLFLFLGTENIGTFFLFTSMIFQ